MRAKYKPEGTICCNDKYGFLMKNKLNITFYNIKYAHKKNEKENYLALTTIGSGN